MVSRTALEAQADREPPPEDDHAFFGQPRGLFTLSGLEVWERFSFLGMQAILVLYFADTVAHGGMGMSSGTAASVSAAYGTLVYLVSVAGGWLADRILGSYRAVLSGGILIACGHYTMAVPTPTMTWGGLGLISAGTGLLNPTWPPWSASSTAPTTNAGTPVSRSTTWRSTSAPSRAR